MEGLRPQQNVIDGQPQRAYTHLLMRLSLVLLFVWLNLTPSFALAASLNTICLNTELSLWLPALAVELAFVCPMEPTEFL